MEKLDLKAIVIAAAIIAPHFISTQDTAPQITEVEEAKQLPQDVEEPGRLAPHQAGSVSV